MWSEKDQLFRMRWVLFWVFVVLFCVIVFTTLSVVFFNIGVPTETERETLFYTFIVEIGVAVVTLFYSMFKLKVSKEKIEEIKRDQTGSEDEMLMEVVKKFSAAGITNFIPSRDFYSIYRSYAPSIDKYIAVAKKSVVMVSINLITGLSFDGLCQALKLKLESRSTPISIVISLLNPWKSELMSAIAPVLDLDSKKLSDEIKDTLRKLTEFRAQLSDEARNRFEIRVHNAIPFGSAIMIDHQEDYGRIQIETKPYKVPIRKSFAFEVRPSHQKEGLSETIREGYEALLKDGKAVGFEDFY